jgi:hypothetical protein
MRSFLDGQSITVAIPLVDEEGNCISASAVQYRVIDETGEELVIRGGLAGFNSGDAQAVVTVDGSTNTLVSGGPRRGIRIIELFLTTSAGSARVDFEYIIELEAVLALGNNSFQSYHEALLVGYDIPNLPGWNAASKKDRIAAMVAAWRNIGLLHLRYFAEEIMDMSRIVYITAETGNLTILTANEFMSLPELMRSAVCRAQVMEADSILGSDEFGEARDAGLVSLKVGESEQVFRPISPYRPTLCKRAMKEIGRYIVHGKRLGRG